MTALIATYQRHRDAIEDALVAGLLALLVGRFLAASNTMVGEWRIVATLAIFAVTVYSRDFGYLVAVAALAWPIWFLSPYLMALFLAVALLPRGWIVAHLPWAVLVAAAPLLAAWQALALVPLAGGLLGGRRVGAATGGLAVLWLAMVAGLVGRIGPLAALHGPPYSIAAVGQTVAGANSLEILLLLVKPFAAGAMPLLLLLLQAVGWGAGGWVAGWLATRAWRGQEPRYPTVLALASGSLLLWATLYLLPRWLQLQPLFAFLDDTRPAAGIALSALTAAIARYAHRLVTRPALAKRARRDRIAAPIQRQAATAAAARPLLATDDDDVIMLEMD